jgi:hypothetical protein
MTEPNASGVDVGAHPTGGTVLPATRWLALFVIPFLVVAAAILWFWPDQTGRLFAWPIKPNMTAMLLATAYAGGIYFFTRVALAKQWHRVKVGFLPVATFSSLLGVATVLHWDRFTHGHVSFWAWVALYFIAPPLVVAAWWRNRRHDSGRRERDDPAIPVPLRWLIGAMGLALGVLGLVLFVSPGVLIPDWPWKLTPLTARVVSAILAMQAVAFVGIALDERWSAARVMIEAELVAVPLTALAALRAQSDFQSGGASASAIFMVGLSVLWLAMGGLLWVMQRRGAQLGGTTAAMRT